MIISLEGNIGSGKTTFLEALAISCPDYEIVLEPIEEWMTEYDGHSILELFYQDKTRWAFTFQNYAIQTLVAAVKKVLEPNKIIVTERSALTSRYVFAQMLKDAGHISEVEWALYLKMFEDYSSQVPLNGIIYLTTGPELSAQRIMDRGRPGETVSLEYLTELDCKHRAWLDSSVLPVLRIGSEYSIEYNIEMVQVFINSLIRN